MKINKNKTNGPLFLYNIHAGAIFSFAPGDGDYEPGRIFIKTDMKTFVELSDGTQYPLVYRGVNNGCKEVILYPKAELNLNN